MNDRFKFRAFDTFTEKMIQNHISICEGELYEWCPDGLHIKHDMGDSAIVMQCTGLKDKNGNLIYEGDIVEFNSDFNGKIRGEIYFDEMGLQIKAKLFYSSNFCLPYADRDFKYFYDKYSIKVIGSIYENPKLLKERK